MLFLGAGASRAFHLPDLSEITEIIMNNISQCKSYEKIIELKNILDKECNNIDNSNEGVDIEILLTVLNIINSEDRAVITNPFRLILQNLNKNEIGKLNINEFNEFKDKVATTFIQNLKIDSTNKDLVDRITNSYNELLSIFNTPSDIFTKIVTTNYDNTIEVFAQNTTSDNFKGYLKHRGFESDGGVPKFYIHQNPGMGIRFLKLHGSLDWWINESRTEITLNENGETYGKNLGKRLMIYPIQDKYISEFPFYYTYNSFKHMLKEEKIVVIIGYSFRDESINNAFWNRLFTETNKRDEFRILVCTKSKEVKDRVRRISKDDKKCSFLEYNFGDEHFIKKIGQSLKNHN
jgi:hypothetical protein